METVAERIKEQMVRYGMSGSQADAALEEAIPKVNELMPDYKEIWAKRADSYPPIIYSLIWVSLRPLILSWIDVNIPQAWYRPMFERKNK